MNYTSELDALVAMEGKLRDIEECDSKIADLNKKIDQERERSLISGLNKPLSKEQEENMAIYSRKCAKRELGVRVMRIFCILLAATILIYMWAAIVPDTDMSSAQIVLMILGSLVLVITSFLLLPNVQTNDGCFKWFLIVAFVPAAVNLFGSTVGGILTAAFLASLVAFVIASKLAEEGPGKYSKKEKTRLARAREQDRVNEEAYIKKENEILERQKNVFLAAKQKYDEQIAKWGDKRLQCLKELQAIPGLADQDKNMSTVSSLISYLRRGRADSIKEALNLYIVEQREISRAVSARIAQENLRDAIKRQEEENNRRLKAMSAAQEEHNRKMRELAEENARKVDKAIEDIKKGNH